MTSIAPGFGFTQRYPVDRQMRLPQMPADRLVFSGRKKVGGVGNKDISKEDRLKQANNQFGFALLQKVIEQSGVNGNIFMSPYSIAAALDMALNGAAETTYLEMRQVLRRGNLSIADINRLNRELKEKLESLDEKAVVRIANALYANTAYKSMDLSKKYLKALQENYGAEVDGLDFTQKDSVNHINAWVNSRTKSKATDRQGMITHIVDSLNPAGKLVLLNAIVFDGQWDEPFEPTSTQPGIFNAPDGKMMCQMMDQTHGFKHTYGAGYQAVRLPYGNGKASMVVVLPNEGVALEDFYRKLDAREWQNILKGFERRDSLFPGIMEEKVHIRMPRFHAEYNLSLAAVLESLGLKDAFSEEADFSNMFEQKGKRKHKPQNQIDQVIHKAVVDVAEKFTKAAATTFIGMAPMCSSSRERIIDFFVDRPFFFAIESGGLPIFYGAISKPQDVSQDVLDSQGDEKGSRRNPFSGPTNFSKLFFPNDIS